jgi:TolB protein
MARSLVLIPVILCLPAWAGQIAYISSVSIYEQTLYVVDSDTGEKTTLYTAQELGRPVWSPDGHALAFEFSDESGIRIGIVRIDTGQTTLIAHQATLNRWPRWSGDGRKLAYGGGLGPESRIIVYDPDTQSEVIWGGDRAGMMRPVWLDNLGLLAALAAASGEVFDKESIRASGAVQHFALVAVGLSRSDAGAKTDMFVLTKDRTLPLPMEALNLSEDFSEWAAEPATKAPMLAFETNDGGDREVFIASVRSTAYDASNHHAADWGPVWAPDCRWLAFESMRSGRRGIYRVNPEAVQVAPIAVSEDADNWSPTWSPDGESVAFTSNRDGVPGIFVCDVRGKNTRRVSDPAEPAHGPAWRPEVRP